LGIGANVFFNNILAAVAGAAAVPANIAVAVAPGGVVYIDVNIAGVVPPGGGIINGISSNLGAGIAGIPALPPVPGGGVAAEAAVTAGFVGATHPVIAAPAALAGVFAPMFGGGLPATAANPQPVNRIRIRLQVIGGAISASIYPR
jgi:hypothetical protein